MEFELTGIGYRKKAFKCLPHKCDKCGLDKLLEVHHKDGNRKNNKVSNLRILCKECHRKLENRGKPKPKINKKYQPGTSWKKKK